MKYCKSLFTLTLLTIAQSYSKAEKIVLSNPVLKMIDGMPFALDGENIANMLKVRREIRLIQFGKPNQETHTMEGTYSYEGKPVSLHTLARIEEAIKKEYHARRDALDHKHIINHGDYENEREASLLSLHKRMKAEESFLLETHEEKDVAAMIEHQYTDEKHALEESLKLKYVGDREQYAAERQELDYEFKDKMKALQSILEMIKKDYHEATGPFMQQAHGIKKFLFKLIKESCAKRGRLESFLMQWGKIREEEEHRVFESYMTTLQRMDEFCTDLCNFFEDLVNSCPKGWKQFQELYHNNHK